MYVRNITIKTTLSLADSAEFSSVNFQKMSFGGSWDHGTRYFQLVIPRLLLPHRDERVRERKVWADGEMGGEWSEFYSYLCVLWKKKKLFVYMRILLNMDILWKYILYKHRMYGSLSILISERRQSQKFEHEIFSPDSMMLRQREKFDKKLRKI